MNLKDFRKKCARSLSKKNLTGAFFLLHSFKMFIEGTYVFGLIELMISIGLFVGAELARKIAVICICLWGLSLIFVFFPPMELPQHIQYPNLLGVQRILIFILWEALLVGILYLLKDKQFGEVKGEKS